MEKPNGKKSKKERGSVSPKMESCKYMGVRKRKWGKWVSEIRLPNSRERLRLGSYDSPEKAARAFDAALFCLRGHAAKFNFPDNPPEIPGGRSLSPSEIQLAAARLANSFSPEETLRQTQVVESQCASSSDWPAKSDGLLNSNGKFLDLPTTMGSGNFAVDYGIFPGFDELNSGFIAPTQPDQVPGGVDDYDADEISEGGLAQDSFLWNF